MGGRLHLLLDVVGHRLRRLRRRRLLPAHRRLEGGQIDDRLPRRRRLEHGGLEPPPREPGRPDLPHRRRQPVHLDRLHRAARARRCRSLDRHRRRQLRQRPGGVGHGNLQDRAPSQPGGHRRQRRPLEGSRRPRDLPPAPGCRGSTPSASTPSLATAHRPSSRRPGVLPPPAPARQPEAIPRPLR